MDVLAIERAVLAGYDWGGRAACIVAALWPERARGLVSAMGYNNQAKFEREAYEYIVGKDAMIIDVRFNSGGNIAETLIDWLERKPPPRLVLRCIA